MVNAVYFKGDKRKMTKEECEIETSKAIMEMRNHIADLEKENAELKEKLEAAEKARNYWKDSSFDWRHKCTSRKPFRAAVKAQKQLTQAMNHIHRLLVLLTEGKRSYAVIDEARAFLKEV